MNVNDFQYFPESELDESTLGTGLRNLAAGMFLGLAARTSPLVAQNSPSSNTDKYRAAIPEILDIANADYGLENYISTNRLFDISNNIERVAYDYVRKNETLGSKVFRNYTRKYIITVPSSTKKTAPIKIVKEQICYKVYKVNEEEHAIGMGFNLLKQPELVVEYCRNANRTGTSYYIFDEKGVPLDLTIDNVRDKARYVECECINSVTERYFAMIISKVKREYNAAGGNWNVLPRPVKLVFIDIGYWCGGISKFKETIKQAKKGNWVGVIAQLKDSNIYNSGNPGLQNRLCRDLQMIWMQERRTNRYFDLDATSLYAKQKNNMIKNNAKPPKVGTPEHQQLMAGQKGYMSMLKAMQDADTEKPDVAEKTKQTNKNGKQG